MLLKITNQRVVNCFVQGGYEEWTITRDMDIDDIRIKIERKDSTIEYYYSSIKKCKQLSTVIEKITTKIQKRLEENNYFIHDWTLFKKVLSDLCITEDEFLYTVNTEDFAKLKVDEMIYLSKAFKEITE